MSELELGSTVLRSSLAWDGNRECMGMRTEVQGMHRRNFLFRGRWADDITIDYRHTLIPPLGYKVAGISGSSGAWVDGFSLIIMH